MAKLSARGRTELERWTKDGYYSYVFMSDGKVLRGGSGRYNVVKLVAGKTSDDLKARLQQVGYAKQ